MYGLTLGSRSRQQALDTYRLAIFYGRLTGQSRQPDGGAVFLRMAWLFREAEETDKEQLALVEARKYYEEALMREPLPIRTHDGNFARVYHCGTISAHG